MLVFENRGREVGATIDHPHGQIYGYPFVPPAPAREARRRARTTAARCAREVERELAAGARIVARTRRLGRVGAVRVGLRVRHALRAARAHRRRSPRSTTRRATTSRALLVDALGRYDRLWPAPHAGYLFPYLLWFHQAPASGGDEWHLHAHIAPPLRAPGVPRYVASGELGSGTLSNPVVPEDAARGAPRCLSARRSARRAAST